MNTQSRQKNFALPKSPDEPKVSHEHQRSSPSPLNGLRANASAKDNSIWAGVRGETVPLAFSLSNRFLRSLTVERFHDTTLTMCGRYSLGKKPRSWPQEAGEFQPRFNIAPTQNAPVFLGDGSLKQMRWGLIPSWAEDESVGYKMINARAETVAEKPAFRRCLEKQRCIIPADGFYEWRRSAGAKTPMRFLLQDDEPFAFAGLWERWYPRGRERVESFTILTTAANDLVRPVHDRMPVMLDAAGAMQWLDGARDFASLQMLLRPFVAERMRHYLVSSRLNDAYFEHPSCIEPVPDLQPALPGM